MPKIKITEQDLTVALPAQTDNVVFVPIEVLEANVFEPTLVSTVAQLEALCPQANAEDDGWFIAKRLLGFGMLVLVQGVTALSEVNWSISGLADKSKYDIRFLTTGAFEHFTVNSEDVIVDDGTNFDMMECARLRGDAVALCDHPKELESSTQVKAYTETTGDEGTFGAMFSPWATFLEGQETITLPGSYSFLASYAVSIRNNPSWLAVAGSARGIVPGLKSTLIEYGSYDINVLQGRSTDEDDLDTNEGVAINPIAFVRPFGVLVWGNRTLKTNESGTTALSFLNVRNLVSELKKTLYRAARTVTFEQNSEVLWNRFSSLIYPTLDRMLSGNGINGYKVIKQPTTAKARLKASIRISPIEAVEDFELSVVLQDEVATVIE
jgi:hypothetical protein